jgi:hypothetical protein
VSDDHRVLLAIPADAGRLGKNVTLRWQVDLGQSIGPHDPIARLDGDDGQQALVLQAPDGCEGIVADYRIDDGARVVIGEPVLAVIEHASSRADDFGLSDAAQRPYEPDLPGLSQGEPSASAFGRIETVVAKRLSRNDRASLAVVGAVSVLGLFMAAVGMIVCLVMQSGMPAVVVAVALALMASSLSYGKDRMDRIGG